MIAAVPMTVQRILVPATSARLFCVAHAAAVLHGDRDRLDDAVDDLEVDELAAARGVEVDHMQRLARPAPASAGRSATGSPENTVAWLKSPRRRRTASAVLDVDGRKESHSAVLSVARRTPEVRQQAQPRRRTLLWVELYRPDVVVRDCGDVLAAVVGDGGDDRRVGRARGVRMDEVRRGRAAGRRAMPRPPAASAARSSRCAAP